MVPVDKVGVSLRTHILEQVMPEMANKDMWKGKESAKDGFCWKKLLQGASAVWKQKEEAHSGQTYFSPVALSIVEVWIITTTPPPS